MTKVDYTLLGEGVAEYFFIPGYLNTIGKEFELQFKRSSKRIKPGSNPSKSKVYNTIHRFAVDSLIVDEENLFIAGVDLDKPDHSLIEFEAERSKLLAKIPKEADQNKIVLFIPIQAIDHWLLYLKIDSIANNLESTKSDDIKRQLYGRSKPNEAQIRKYAEKTYSIKEYNKLATLSKSFKRLHEDINRFCKNYK